MNVYQRLMDIFVGITILFLIPMMCFKQISEQYFQNIAYEYTRKLGYEIETQGYLTKAMYDDYVQSLSFIDDIFGVQFEHTKKRYEPIYKRDQNNEFIFTGEIMTYEEQTFTEEILNDVHKPNGCYRMEKGDTIIITLTTNRREIFQRILTFAWKEQPVRYARYSGMIRGYKFN